MKKYSKSEITAMSALGLLFLLLVIACVIAVSSLGMLKKAEKKLTDYRSKAEVKLSELEKSKNTSLQSLSDMENRLMLAENSRDELEIRIKSVENELKTMSGSIEDKDGLYSSLNEKLAELNETLAMKQSEIDALKKDIDVVGKAYSIDMNKQAGLIRNIEKVLSEDAPMNKVQTPLYNENGTPLVDEDGKPQFDDKFEYPKISVYYEDIERGYSYSWNTNYVFNSASCVKAGFALSILSAASDEDASISAEINDFITRNGSDAVIPEFERKYDFDTVFTYTEKAYRSGSGVIKDQEYGVQYTHMELFEKMLKYSDTVAYAELKSQYGISLYKKLATKLGTTAIKKNYDNATAKDLGLVMKAIYEFTESDAKYAEFMKKTMMSSANNVMISPGVSPKKTAHKYGWDSGTYHDMAIVYDKHPYVLVFMSDMDSGGNTVNKYIQKIAGMIDDLHENFYK